MEMLVFSKGSRLKKIQARAPEVRQCLLHHGSIAVERGKTPLSRLDGVMVRFFRQVLHIATLLKDGCLERSASL